jgi:hypothetical protein
MDNKSFWLLDINTSVLSVSLVNYTGNAFIITAIGPRVPFTSERESIVSAVDSSLSSAAKSVAVAENEEPNTAALILPPLWIGSDGKIIPQYLKLIENICRDLDFKPMGFIANDEAIVEDANHSDSFPASFVLVNFSEKEMFVSLAYIGKIIERITKPRASTFDPVALESALIEFKTESTLPPQLIIFGDVNQDIIEPIKNYPWVGKKNIETFLHFPDIKTYSPSEITQIYTRAITSQFSQPIDNNIPSPPPETIEDVDIPETTEVVDEPTPLDLKLTEVSAADLGFTSNPQDTAFSSDNLTIPKDLPEIISETPVVKPFPSRPKFKLPSFPKFHFPPLNFLLFPLVLSPLLILIPFLFSQAHIILYLTPYTFNQQINVTLDPAATIIDVNKNIIPVNKQTFNINSTASITTTGQKTVGAKATGEAVIFNKKDKSQPLSQGTVLIDPQGNNYVLTTSAQVASSSANLDLGVITLGQTKVIISAVDIGPEYNLPNNTQLHFKDFPETDLIAKVDIALTGGAKNQVSAVSAADKTNIEQKISSIITAAVNDKVDQNVKNIKGLIKNSVQINKGRIDYSREVGEEADTLTAVATSNINVFSLTPENQIALIKAYLSPVDGFNNSTINPDNFDFSITPKGVLTINGTVTPQFDSSKIISLISGKSLNTARTLIKTNVPRVYNFEITTNFQFLQSINPLPFRGSNIIVEVK